MQSSFADLEYAAMRKVTRRDRFLAEIEAFTPWSALLAELEAFYPKGGGRGRPPIGLGRMLRMYIAQQCFSLLDEGIEDALYDSHAIRRFVGVNLGREAAPDATTLLKFRRLLERHDLTRRPLPNTDEGRLAAQWEVLKAKIRAKVEHPFHVVKNHFQHRKVRYWGLAKNEAQLFTLFGRANLMLAQRMMRCVSTRAAS